jgi:hypothetical protein
MKRALVLFAMLSLVLVSVSAFAQKKPAGKKPTKQVPIMLEEKFKGTTYTLVPIEVVYPENHAQLQAMFPEKSTFFWLVVDNRRGEDTVTFDPKKGDVTLIMEENKGRRTMVNLTESLKDPSVAAKVSQAFKEAYVPIEVPKGEMKRTLVLFSPFLISDIRSALWSFPGENKNMKPKRMTPADIKRLKIEPVGGESEKEKKAK